MGVVRSVGWVQAWLLVLWVGACLPSLSFAQVPDPFQQAADLLEEELEGDKDEIEARIAAAEAELARKKARVLVLPWPGSDIDERHLGLKTFVQARIGRPSAKFYPAMDMYQEGRYQRAFGPLRAPSYVKQDGRVDDVDLQEIQEKFDITIPVDLTGKSARKVLDYVDYYEKFLFKLFYVENEVARQALFDLYVYTGSAAESLPSDEPPYFRAVGSKQPNYYLYLAAALLWEDRELELEAVSEHFNAMPDTVVKRSIEQLVKAIDSQAIPLIPLSFQDNGQFDLRRFAKDYKLFINGAERELNAEGIVMVPRGRIHVHLERNDGYGLSEVVEVQALQDKIYFVLETARQRMGYGLLRELMAYPNECTPGLSEASRINLALYAALHPDDEFYIAVPRYGAVGDLYVWRYDPIRREVNLLQDPNRGFPVRFAVLASTGMSFNGLETDLDVLSALENDIQNGALPSGPPTLPQLTPTPSGVPFDLQLRIHFHRLMVGIGAQTQVSITGAPWADRYQTDLLKEGDNDRELISTSGETQVGERILRERIWQRLLYAQLGVMLGRDAPFGMGPRGSVRVGFSNVPHVVSITGHLGVTEQPGKKKRKEKGLNGRFQPVIDAGVYGGIGVPFGDSIYFRNVGGTLRPQILPEIGVTAGGGFTF